MNIETQLGYTYSAGSLEGFTIDPHRRKHAFLILANIDQNKILGA